MNRLWVRLTLAFGLVLIVGIGLAVFLINRQVDTGFRRYVTHSQLDAALIESLASYYDQNGSWDDVEAAIKETRPPGKRRGAPKQILTDAEGRVVYADAGAESEGQLDRRALADGAPITVGGQTVGYLLLEAGNQTRLSAAEQAFLDQVTRSLYQAGLIAGVLAIVLGLLIARGLSAPLSRLAAAAGRISQGELDQRVPEKGSEEVVKLSRAFNDMAAELQQAERLRRDMVADIAHELRTPLTVIQGNLKAILDDVYPLEKREIATIYDETLMLGRLISDLRELSQAEAGQLSLNIAEVEIEPLITSTTDMISQLAREKDIRLTATIREGLPAVMADPQRLRQVLYNLLSNAIKHTPVGDEVEVLAEPVKRDGVTEQIRVSVSDSGPGISADTLPYVFDRFWQAERSGGHQERGSGLGLAIARQLVVAQGGEMGVESEVGRGSRFWFTIPTQVKPT